MQMEKKRIRKEDGRYLVYYHFPASATPEETAAYGAIEPERPGAMAEGTAADADRQEEKHGV
jgi:hypothetical protein